MFIERARYEANLEFNHINVPPELELFRENLPRTTRFIVTSFRKSRFPSLIRGIVIAPQTRATEKNAGVQRGAILLYKIIETCADGQHLYIVLTRFRCILQIV